MTETYRLPKRLRFDPNDAERLAKAANDADMDVNRFVKRLVLREVERHPVNERSGHVWPLEQQADNLVSWVDDDISLHEVHAILEWLENHDCLNAVGQAFSTVFWQEYLEDSGTND